MGALSVISPFSIDMYLPSYSEVAASFDVPSAMISLTLSSYFIGMALGQIFYGPLLDRFGRKRPLYAGLTLYILTSLGCAFAPTIDALIALRFVQAIGGCVAGVASLAIVRDFFPAEESAKILSRLFLFIAVSPLLAPSIGGMIALAVGWRAVFFVLALVVSLILALIYFKLPETHTPDKSISLKPAPIFIEYLAILNHPRFIAYALSGAFSFAGLFTFVAGSPLVFMDGFHVSATTYSGIFAMLAMGFIITSQFNVVFLKKSSSEQLYLRFLSIQVVAGVIFMIGTWFGWYGLIGTMFLFFIMLACVGITYPNAAALALMPFTKNAGSAAALLGFLQLGVGSLISVGISFAPSSSSFTVIAIMGITSILGFIILLMGRKRAHASPIAE